MFVFSKFFLIILKILFSINFIKIYVITPKFKSENICDGSKKMVYRLCDHVEYNKYVAVLWIREMLDFKITNQCLF